MARTIFQDIHSRASWGARHRAGFGDRRRNYPLGQTYLHHSVTAHLAANATVAQERAQMRVLERIGQQRFGGGISYNFAIFPSGRCYMGTGASRIGAHTGGRNSVALGVVLVGNYETNSVTPAMIATYARLLYDFQKAGIIRTVTYRHHRDVSSTACPGRHAVSSRSRVRSQMAQLRSGGATSGGSSSGGSSSGSSSSGGSPSGTSSAASYTVKRGDTLGAIATRHRTSVRSLQFLNGISDPNSLTVGQRLHTRFNVSRGQTLGGIAQLYNRSNLTRTTTSAAALARLNGISNANSIRVGQKLRLP